MSFMFSPGCCCANCTIFRDTFDVDDLTANWDQRSGTWAIAGGEMTVNAGSSVNIYDFPHPDTLPDMYVYASVKGDTEDDTARVIIGYVDDNNYFFGQIRFTGAGGTGTPYVRLGKVDAGTESYLTSEVAANLDGSGWATLVLCYSGGRLTLNEFDGVPPTSISDAVVSATSGVNVTLTGTQCGVGVDVQTGVVTFGQFDFEYYVGGDHPTCRACRENCTYCDSGTTPYAMQITFYGVANNWCTECPDFFNDTTFLLRPTGSCGFAIPIDACTDHPVDPGDTITKLISIGGTLCGASPVRRNAFGVAQTGRSETINASGTTYGFDFTCGGPWDCSEGVTGRLLDNIIGYPTFSQCDWSGASYDAVALV